MSKQIKSLLGDILPKQETLEQQVSFWFSCVPVISTAHIQASDNAALDTYCRICQPGNTPSPWLTASFWLDDGYLLLTDYDPKHLTLSAELQTLLKDLNQHGYRFVRLDPDGDILQGYPTFDW